MTRPKDQSRTRTLGAAKSGKRVRVNMRIPTDLVEFIKEYTACKNSTMTQDYIQYLEAKMRRVEKAHDKQLDER